MARGMHRGSLDRTSAKGRASPLKRAASAAALLLPLVTIPIINQLESGGAQPLLAPGHKKDSARGDVFDVQASSLLRAEYGASGGRALRRSPSGGGGSATAGSAKAGAAFRRKALDMG